MAVAITGGCRENGEVVDRKVTDLTSIIQGINLPDSIDLSDGDVEATIGLLVSPFAEVTEAVIYFDRGIPGTSSSYAFLGFWGFSSDWSDGREDRSVTFLEGMAAGDVSITRIKISTASEAHWIEASELSEAGFDLTFSLSGGVEDLTGPVVTALSMPKLIDLSSGSVAADFSILVEDATEGFSAILRFDRELPSYSNYYDFVILSDWQSMGSDPAVSLPQDLPNGLYTLQSIDLEDKLGNQSELSASEIAALGFPDQFQVTGSSYDPLVTLVARQYGSGVALELVASRDFAVGDEFELRLSTTASPVEQIDLLGSGSLSSRISSSNGSTVSVTAAVSEAFAEGESLLRILLPTASLIDLHMTVEHAEVNQAETLVPIEGSLVGTAGDNAIIGTTGEEFISGRTGNDTLNGSSGDDTLDGGAGVDLLIGGQGSDLIFVDDVGDRVAESRKWAGHDMVVSTVDFRMGIKHIEDLELRGEARIGAGNGLKNVITGNDGDNILDGGKNNDTLVGGAGDDTYILRAPGDIAVEEADGGIDIVKAYGSFALMAHVEKLYMQNVLSKEGTPVNFNGIGNGLDNTIVGTPFDNTIIGREGRDVLKGQAGADTFVFDRAIGADNVDRIIDFNVNEADEGDVLKMKGSVFGGLAAGVLDAALFVVGTVAADADDRFVFDRASGQLWFDVDGAGGAAQELIATFEQNALVTAANIEIF